MRAIFLFLIITVGLISTSCVGNLFQDNDDFVKAKVETEQLSLINFSSDTVYYFAIESELAARANYVLRSSEQNQLLPKSNTAISWSQTGSSKSGDKIIVMYWKGDAPKADEEVKSFTVKR
ncbi:hypothetical protein [Gracilimonas mengyeensis]|uniref:Uncharacterized protein n=1 Tax=Gracilimonas mengyeensis TaxID=1302730 RepID=A0A521BWP2_9BACT|nr:hypothetical protein [Gracilimonas mengyeensis]SMO51603.1 hypothetical protein SAMN06265219_103168 [Gracilimonas mengyeensis]